jgi:ribose 5-phosphate isomerase A
MTLHDGTIEAFLAKYVSNNMVLSFGTGKESTKFVKKLALKIEGESLDVSVVPTNNKIAEILGDLGIKTVSLNDKEIDLAVEFVDLVDKDFNFIEQESASFVRDKMIAQGAAELVVITEKGNYGQNLFGNLPFEVCVFGWKRTLLQLEKLGEAGLRERNGKPFRTETGHYVIDVKVDEVYSLEDLEFQAKDIPGVLETGLFIGYADRVLLHDDKKLHMLSRLDYSKQDTLGQEKPVHGLMTL